ncbi:tRNA epoxyqueuosine(34) reductase QueG [Ilumatobacter nonamiensis]|uniref:tRNA epoxyqueuosine(34) reductase QueG n=1 Tax=Ilumatobacter nonamiensis TaxID=467093 RepID=UPI0003466151|nr:tRNA epoxyqueuosine(34) reductase QueG [Ilumatobacter nonamiensis]
MTSTKHPPGLPTLAEIGEVVAPHGISRLGVASADVLEDTRSVIHERKARGLNDGMQFTYRNPDRSTDPRRALPSAESVIVAARPYLTDTEPTRPVSGVPARVGRYAWVDHYEPLRVGLRAAAAQIEAAGHRALVFADDNSLVDRAIAQRAGLGWFGKNANLLLPGAGSFFVLGSIVTDAFYEPNGAPASDGCGSCVRCIDACPTDAIVAPGVIDGARCLSWVLQKPGPIPVEFRSAVGDRMYGCDDCQDVCPISVRLGPRNTVELDVEGDEVQAFVDAIELLGLDDATIEARHGRWWIAGREMRWLRRNALVVIGNRADPEDREARAVLDRYRSDDDPILVEHAVWADARLDERTTPTS